MENIKLLRDFLFQSIFWGWNLIFLTVVYCGILPFVGIFLVIATFEGTVPVDFCLTFIALIAVPTVSTIYGLKYLIKQPQELMRWFYGVEAPLVVWCLVRLFLIRELTPASTLVLGTLLVCIVAFAIEVLQGYRANRRVFSWLQTIAHTLMLFSGVYLGSVLLFYALPVAAYVLEGAYQLIVGFFSFNWVEGFWRVLNYDASFILFSGLYAVLFGFSSALFVGMPFVLTNLLINSGKKVVQAFARQYGRQRAIQVGVAVISTWLILFNVFNRQPQIEAFNLLEQTPQNRTELLASVDTIRQGLVNANLYPYRYLSTREDNDHIYAMYHNLGLPKSVSGFVRERYNQLLSPFLYRGSRGDVAKSAQLYAEFFDTPLQKAERKAVRHAIQSTAIVDRAQAGLLNIDQKKVWLAKQEVKIDPHGNWANVELHEVYENQTNDVEEILYYFSLPESAAITGLWLGESEDLSQRFDYQVSPRGAAQEVYNAQVRRTRPVDPALLEQVGSGQYRLRAFPVPPKRNTSRNGIRFETPQMHLWLSYQVMRQERGWALPKLAEKRNIFWTWHTTRIRDGNTKWFFADTWLEDFAPAQSNVEPEAYRVKLQNGYIVTAKPLSDRDYALPQDRKYALILDTSYSMRSQRDEIIKNLYWWQENLSDNDVDLYLSDATPERAKRLENFNSLNIDRVKSLGGASTHRSTAWGFPRLTTRQRLEATSKLRPLNFFGSLQTEDLLQQFQSLRKGKDYDAVLVLTDEGSYELSNDEPVIPNLDSPLWMVHLGGLPRAYNDEILQVIKNNNGGVARDVSTVIERLATEKARDSLVVDGYSWKVNQSVPEISNNGLEAIAARQLVANLARSKSRLSIEKLDAIHQIAKNYGIVTPYSSMLVLVNDRQREQLKAAEAKSDRFDREVETGVEQLETPFNPLENAQVSGVPEPDIWILLAIVILALFLIVQRQKQSKSVNQINS